jgi:hypothetical protein
MSPLSCIVFKGLDKLEKCYNHQVLKQKYKLCILDFSHTHFTSQITPFELPEVFYIPNVIKKGRPLLPT